MTELPKSEDAATEALMGEIVDEFLNRVDRGERPEIDEYVRRYPQLATVLRQMLPALGMLRGSVADRSAVAMDSCEPITPEGPLGDYRLVREVGRGGMGVVYEAVQISLGRRVAVKVLPFASALDARQLQRFKNEAQAAALLHHRSIVPVHGVGSDRGVHYYAMQFIEGQTLAALIQDLRRLAGLDKRDEPASPGAAGSLAGDLASGRWTPHERGSADSRPTGPYTLPRIAPQADLPTIAAVAISTEHSTRTPPFFRTVANLGVRAAEALEHAHGEGVVHRDVKPANLMVDGRGNLWVTDFGLAHCQSQAGLTMTGDLVGTLRYMSPEQALAQRVVIDHRTDIYSLGATLYELLTLQPVFNGRDRQELLRQIAFEEPRPARRLNKAIPAELETIVLKAMEKIPAERYATAKELADDLERFLKDESIRAQRPSPLQRARKWARRHQGVVRTALTALTFLLVTIAVGASLAAWQLNVEQSATRAQLHLTEDAQEKATRRFYDARLTQVRSGSLSRRPGQRLDSLDTLAEAAKIAQNLDLPEECLLERRNAAIACLALPDLRLARQWSGWPARSDHVDFDGKLVRYARADTQGAVSIRRVAGDEEIAHLPGSGSETGLLFSRDGKFLAVSSASGLNLWELGGPKPVLAASVPAGDCYGVDFSPDSRQCAIGHADGSISLYDLNSGQPPRRLPVGGRAAAMAFDPDGRRLAISSETSVEIRHLDTGKVVTLRHQVRAGNLAWHPGGMTLAVACNDSRIYLWDVAARKQTLVFEGLRNLGIQIAFNHAGDLLASTGWEGMLRLWDPRTGKQLFGTQSGMSGTPPRFSLDDRLLAGDVRDGKLGLWEVSAGSEYLTLVRASAAGRGGYESAAIRSDVRLLAVGMHDGIGFWDLTSGKELAFIELPGADFALFERSGALLTNGPAGLLRWPIREDSASPGLLRIGPPHQLGVPEPICHIASSLDGKVIAVSQFQGGRALHADRADQPVRLGPHNDARFVAVSPDGRTVATGSHNRWGVKIWDAQSGEPVKVLAADQSRVGFSPDGKWLATTGDGLRLWAIDSWREGPRIGGVAFAFSADGTILAVETGYGAVRLVNPDTGREYARLEDPNQDIARHLSFSPDGTQLVATNDGSQSVHVWDLRTIRRQLTGMGLDWDLPPYSPFSEANRSQALRVHVELGDLAQLLGDRKPITRQVIEQERRALEANPNSAAACNALAWSYLTAPEALRDWKAAVPLAQQAVQRDPNPLYRNTLGLAYYRAGRYREAVEALQANLKDQENWVLAYDLYFLAMSHHQLGDGARASDFYDLAVRWSASNQESLALYAEELAAFRAETEGVLGHRQPAKPKDEEPEPGKK